MEHTSPRPSRPEQGHSEFSFKAAEHLVGGQGVNGCEGFQEKTLVLVLVLLEKEYDLHFCDTLQFQKPLVNASTSKFYF